MITIGRVLDIAGLTGDDRIAAAWSVLNAMHPEGEAGEFGGRVSFCRRPWLAERISDALTAAGVTHERFDWDDVAARR